ncbi:phospholipase D-like domain-containing protein [Paraburkholderia sediminicola]|uniref:hypothetical protein n=1 Tax=Paraburkholderia sediminicola TaxID=458836 RepID=UPI0038BAEA1F
MTLKDAPDQFHTNARHSWKKAVKQCQGDILVFSPYLTSGVAESMMIDGTKAQVHTVFDVENFASGASSLRTLRALIKTGHELYHVPGLHAKVVLDRRGFVSIGSQNITKGGLRNRGVSATFHTDDAAGDVFKRVGPRMKERVPITAEMINEMEALFEPAQVLLEQAQTRAAELQRVFDEAQEVQAKAEQERQRLEDEERNLQRSVEEERA